MRERQKVQKVRRESRGDKWNVQEQLEVMIMRKICEEGEERETGAPRRPKNWSISGSAHPEEAFGAVSYVSSRSGGFVEEVDKLFITWSFGFRRGKNCTFERKAEIRKWARMSELISLQQVRFWVTVEFLSLHDEYPEMPEQQTSVIVAWYLAISNPTVSDFRFCRPQRKNWAEASKRFSLWNFTLKVLNPLQSWFCALTEIYHCFFQIKKREKMCFSCKTSKLISELKSSL